MITRGKIWLMVSISILAACEVRERLPEIATEEGDGAHLPVLGTPVDGQITSIGAAVADFVPDQPTSLAGFGGAGRRFLPPLFTPDGDLAFCKPYQKILHPPRIKTAVFNVTSESGQTQNLFLVSLDTVAITSDLLGKVHAAINSANPNTTAQLNNTTVIASHTHSGVAGLTENPLWGAFVCDQYNDRLTGKFLETLKETVVRSLSNRKTIASIESRTIRVPTLLKSRSGTMRSEDHVHLLQFMTADQRPAVSLLQLAAHPTTFGTKDLVLTSDLVSPLEEAVKSSNDSEYVFLMQTEIGNMDANMDGMSLESWAAAMADALQNTASEKHQTSNLNIKTSAGFFELPSKRINWHGCDATAAKAFMNADILNALPQKVPYSSWKLQGETFLFLAGEWTTSAADALREKLSQKNQAAANLKVFSLAHDYTAYHLSPSEYEKKSLESCSSIYGPTVSEDLARQLNSNGLPL
ncbi:MAG: Neutral/alkaline non-lysosomal ceramidase, N-terminal [Pseudomonadota bacterium]